MPEDVPGVPDSAGGATSRRRVLLMAGGLTLLAGCSAAAAERSAATAQASHAHATRPSPASVRPSAARTARTARNGHHRAADHWVDDGQPMYYVDAGRMAIALTIDDGPSAIYTPQVLKLLSKYQVTATFSMIGIEVDELPEVARDVVAAGHMISNHTWRHLDLAVLSPSAVIDEMDRATEAIHRATGVVPGMFRAPYGAWSPTVLRRCAETGMTPLDWSVDPRDWARPGTSSIVRNIMRNTRTGSIILEHDGGGDRSETVAALGIVIPRLLDAGYHFTTP